MFYINCDLMAPFSNEFDWRCFTPAITAAWSTTKKNKKIKMIICWFLYFYSCKEHAVTQNTKKKQINSDGEKCSIFRQIKAMFGGNRAACASSCVTLTLSPWKVLACERTKTAPRSEDRLPLRLCSIFCRRPGRGEAVAVIGWFLFKAGWHCCSGLFQFSSQAATLRVKELSWFKLQGSGKNTRVALSRVKMEDLFHW